MAAAIVLAGCGSGADRPSAGTGPRAVALRYAQALFSGHFTAASEFVAKPGLNAFRVLTDGLTPSSVSARNLAVAHIDVAGPAATAVLTGKICTNGGLSTARRCISNTNPDSKNPVFAVRLRRGTDGRWQIVYGAAAP